MDRLKKLRAALAKKVDELKTLRDGLLDGDGNFKALSDEDKTKSEALKKDIEALKAEIAEEEALEAEAAKTTQPADEKTNKNGGTEIELKSNPEARRSSFAQARDGKMTRGVLKAALIMIGVAAKERGLVENPLDVIRAMDGGDTLADEIEWEARSMNASIFSAGGAVVPSYASQEIIDFLYPSTAFLQLNPMRIPMPNGNFTQPGGASQATAGYGEELANAAATEPTFREIAMVAKELSALIPMSNQWLDFSLQGAMAFVERHLDRVMSVTMDSKFLRGDGQQGNPLGIFKIPGIGTGGVGGTYSDATKPTQAEVDKVVRDMILDLTGVGNNVNIRSAKWIMTTRVMGYLADMTDGNGNYIYRELQGDSPRFKRLPVIETTNLPENLGGNGDAAPLGLVAGDHVLMGEAGDMTMSVSKEASYYDANGVMRSAFQRKETLLLGVMRHDVTIDQVKAITYTEDIRWGA